ncbi:DegT/DnrJ/EryC1/StrS aminotransferase family protein [Duncaniella sp.]|uniref:DegT/DnrJ/EryC1/StrS family aminotransferase n=1 Tax=Duncaniella sp. TaxID=2518496 RepID=UPI0023C1A0C6|nr:DegT/DnrJ/EryC1/StrS family aminotransferase [Duncaniella sp.]MDE5905301.1 DegT/DnrJ/EryC1/StrS family aminotransferase [Duncaniella sp.]
MQTKKIHLCLAHMSGAEQRFIDEAFADSWVVPLGPNVDGFEEDLKKFLTDGDPRSEGKEIAALSAGTAAIHLALVLLGVGQGDEVICQSFTFAASANPVVYQGAKPVFVDSEAGSWNMDPELLDAAIADRIEKTGRKPKAIIAVHLYGMPAQMDRICAVADKWGIPVVEDAAEALGSKYQGRMCGTLGHFGILSFNGNKMITTSGGGALVCPDAESKKRALFFATQAREPFPYYQHEHIGYNYRLSNISAGIGRGQMTILDEHIAHHRRLAALYQELFAEIDGISYHANPSADSDSNYWLSTIEIDPQVTGKTPEDLRLHLAALNVETRPLWKPMHLQPVFAQAPAYVNGVSEALFGRGLCLPSGPCVSEDDVRMIVNEIRNCING